MSQPKLSLIVDALMFGCLMAIAGLGLLMKFVLPHSHAQPTQHQHNVDTHLLGLDRHQFGEIHFILALVLLALLVVHIILHWTMILTIYRRLISRQAVRRTVAVVFVLVSVALLLWSFVSHPHSQAQPEERTGATGGLPASAGWGVPCFCWQKHVHAPFAVNAAVPLYPLVN